MIMSTTPPPILLHLNHAYMRSVFILCRYKILPLTYRSKLCNIVFDAVPLLAVVSFIENFAVCMPIKPN